MKILFLLTTFSFLALFTACGEPQADLSTPQTHRSSTLGFNYPKNWKITDDTTEEEVRSLIIETPGDAIVIIQSYTIVEGEGQSANEGKGESKNKEEIQIRELTDFAKGFAEIAAAETPIGKMENSTFANAPDVAGFKWIEEKFDITLLGESVPHRRIYGSKTIGNQEIILILQVAIEDYSKAEAGFHLIRDSLLSSPPSKQ